MFPLSKAVEHNVLTLWKRTNYNDTLWPFIVNHEMRHLEVRIDDTVYVDLCAMAPNGDAESMLRAYFERHAHNVALWVDGAILIFDKDNRTHLERSYIGVSASFYRMICGVFAASVALALIGGAAFLARLFVDSEWLDILLVGTLFFFLANAAIGIASVLLGCHRMQRDDAIVAGLPVIVYIPVL